MPLAKYLIVIVARSTSVILRGRSEAVRWSELKGLMAGIMSRWVGTVDKHLVPLPWASWGVNGKDWRASCVKESS